MPVSNHALRQAPALSMTAIAVALCLCGSAQAEQDPYYIGVSQALSRDTNVLRSTNNEVGDTISSKLNWDAT